jgi:hypothetical protein
VADDAAMQGGSRTANDVFANALSPFDRQAAKCVPYRQVLEQGWSRDVCRNFHVRAGNGFTGFSDALSSFHCNY